MQIPVLTAYLNGRYAPLAELQVSVLDRGFLFGDGVYEVVPVYRRHPFRLDEHLQRLANSLAALRIPNPHDLAHWRQLVDEIVARQTFGDQSVYIQVTRGTAWPRNHAFPDEEHPTVLIYAEPLQAPLAEFVLHGVKAVTMPDIRWPQGHIKSISLIANVLARQNAFDHGASETILIRDGCMIEGSASNIFIVKHGEIYAPAPSEFMLTGVTYDLIRELALAHGMPLHLGVVSEAALRNADEIWLTSSSKEILAIVELDGRKVGFGAPGPIYRKMLGFYHEYKASVMLRGKDNP